MTEKMSIDNVGKLCLVGIQLGNSISDILEDGKVGLTDLPAFKNLMILIPKLKGIDFSHLMPEITDLSAQETALLVEMIKKNLKLKNANIEQSIERVLLIAQKIHGIIQEGSNLMQSFRGTK